MGARQWRRVRKGTQILSLLLFLSLFVYTNAQRPEHFGVDLFSRLDPLLMVTAALAGRVLLGGLVLAGITVLVTLFFGRVWCGWICPLGTLLGWLGPGTSRRKGPSESWRAAKMLLLLASVVVAILGCQVLTVLDPITILTRTLTTAFWPALRHGVVEVEAVLYRFEPLWGPLDVLHGAFVQPLFQEVHPVFGLGVPLALLFAGLVAMNWWAERFWCRYLCPLGGLLGLVSRLSLLRRQVSDACVDCGRCAGPCPTGTVNPAEQYRSDPAECIVCLDCLTECHHDGVGFRWQLRKWRPACRRGYDPSRRQALAVVGASAAGVALLGVEPILRRRPDTLIRPPGAILTEFSALCIRCAACVRVCPTQGLQPSLLEGGLQNFLTPRLVPRLGYCSFGCNACGQVCPTRAIPSLALEEKQRTTIGLASIDRDRCLPWAYSIPCIVCEEVCPVADKAVQLEEVEVVNTQGEQTLLQRPYVVKELCIGCGMCEYRCPMGGDGAVRVHTPPEVVS